MSDAFEGPASTMYTWEEALKLITEKGYRSPAEVAEIAAAAQAEAFERAARWHEKEICETQEQIQRNDDYRRRSGSTDKGANENCRASIVHHRISATAIRALTPS